MCSWLHHNIFQFWQSISQVYCYLKFSYNIYVVLPLTYNILIVMLHTHKNNVFNKHHVYCALLLPHFSTMHSVVVHKHHHCAWNLLDITGWCVWCSLYYSVPVNTAKWTRCKATSTETGVPSNAQCYVIIFRQTKVKLI
jgi:hypothetical protein